MVAHLGERLFRMHNEKIMTDITFVVEGTEIESHKIVVSSHGGPLQELVQGNSERVEIEELPLTTFKTVLQFLYTDGCTLDNANVFELLHAAKLFQLNNLEFCCTSLIKSKICEANILSYTQVALDFDARELLNDCLDYFGNNTTKLMQQKDILEVTQEVLMALCNSPKIECSELDLFLKSIEWAKFQCEQSGKESSPENIRETLGEVLNKIRFTCVGIDDFRKIIVPTKILTLEEIGKVIVTEDQEERRQASANGNVGGSVSSELVDEASGNKGSPNDHLPVSDIVKCSRMKEADMFFQELNSKPKALSDLEVFAAYVRFLKRWRQEDNIQVEISEYQKTLQKILDIIKFTNIQLNDFLDFVVPMAILNNNDVGCFISEMQLNKWAGLPYGCWADTVKVTVLGYNKKRQGHSSLIVPLSTRISALKQMQIFESGSMSYPADKFILTHEEQKLTDDMSLLSIAANSDMLNWEEPSLVFKVHSITITVKSEYDEWGKPLEIETQDLWERDFNVIKGLALGFHCLHPDDVRKIWFKNKVPGAIAVVVEK